jgi:Ca2+-binding RTX toxin-like protein
MSNSGERWLDFRFILETRPSRTGSPTLTNSGTIDGNVFGRSGSDSVTNFAMVGDVMKSGTIDATIDLGTGNDKFTGGANPEILVDDDGADMVALGGGNDTYIATGGSFGADGIDTVRGGAGIDTYDASAATSNVFINLAAVPHDLGPFNPGSGPVAANTATGFDISGTAEDTITGFENAIGGAGGDIIYGTAASNVLSGNGGFDVLYGFGGDDTLNGGAGVDVLFGGAGKDQLTGGADQDPFFTVHCPTAASPQPPVTSSLISSPAPATGSTSV